MAGVDVEESTRISCRNPLRDNDYYEGNLTRVVAWAKGLLSPNNKCVALYD